MGTGRVNYNKTLNLPRTKFSMKADLSNREPEIQKIWEDNNVYQKLLEKNTNSKKFILHDGPPYANGHIHMGHALNRVLKDIVVKYKAMTGFYTPFVPGWDCHGLPVEYELLKQLGSTEIKDKVDFRKKAARYALKFVDIQRKEFKRLGLMGDWDNPYLTLQSGYEEKIIEAFKELCLKKYIYRELKPVYWCSSCKTALAEAEVEYGDISSPSIYVRFGIADDLIDAFQGIEKQIKEVNRNISVLVWTTTPWTLPANVALCFKEAANVNEKVKYWYSFIKNKDEILIIAKEIYEKNKEGLFKDYKQINEVTERAFLNGEFKGPFRKKNSKGLADNFVTLEDGTGIVHIAPGHGEDDYRIIKGANRHGNYGQFPIISPVDNEGKFDETVEDASIVGEYVFDADKKIIEILEKRGLLFRKEDISHSYPHCWRCKKPVIFRATEQWFLSMYKNDLRSKVLEKIKDVTWYPEVSQKRITAMVENRPDWCLSRQRLWGVPIPAFYCEECNEILVTKESLDRVQEFIKKNGSDGWFSHNEKEILGDIKCKCGSSEFRKEEDILDVWFDSGVSSFAVLQTRKNHRWPADMYLEGSDQHRGWFQTSIIPGVAIKNLPPYKSVFTHGFIVDAEGRKMSKSEGNVMSPQEVVQEYGADLLRLWVASENYFKDIKISREILQQVVIYYRRIRNTIRFILGNISGLKNEDMVAYEKMTPLDKFILHKFYHSACRIIDNFEKYLFFRSTREIHDFCNNWLSSFYFNILKDRLYVSAEGSSQRRSTQTVLKIIGEILLKLISPVLSHTAEEAWQLLKKEQNLLNSPAYHESIFLCDIPDIPKQWDNPRINAEWEKIINLRNMVLKKIEEAKVQGVIKDPLESEVSMDASSDEIIEFLKSKKESWKEYFIVSSVKINRGENLNEGEDFLNGKINIKISKAPGIKCVRCWLVSDSVGGNKEHPELCQRCANIIERL